MNPAQTRVLTALAITFFISPTLAADTLTGRVVHISGARDWPWLEEKREGFSPGLRERYHLQDYLHEEIIEALAAADLALARAGAATLGELPARGLPGILVPYPYAGAHQERNADYLVDRGAAMKVHDGDLSGDKLLESVRSILGDGDRLAEMSRRAGELSRHDAADRLVQELRSISGDGLYKHV